MKDFCQGFTEQFILLTTCLYFHCICAATTDHNPELPLYSAAMGLYVVIALQTVLAQCCELISKVE